jgi:predicted alpha/beta superfamily hydrolase
VGVTGAAGTPAAPPTPGPAEVRFEVDLRAEIAAGRFDPARDALGLRGGWAPLDWGRPLLAHALGDGRYGLTVTVDRLPFGGQPVPYKFRRERPGQGPDDGWEPGRNHALVLQPGVQRVVRAFGDAAATLPPQRTGRIDAWGVMDSRHVRARAVQVWVPPGLDGAAAGRTWPVLVLHDGQNVFDARAAGAEWMVDETAQRLSLAGAIDPPLIVAVDSGPDRLHDYTPTRESGPTARGGGAPAYARFLVEELLPAVAARYPARSGPAHTAVGGASLGGLVSLWLALAQGHHFGAALVVSPSLWWDGGVMQRTVLARPAVPDGPLPRLWLDAGRREGPGMVNAVRSMRQSLMARGWNAATLAVHEDDGAHDEASWAARVEGMLRFLYGRPGA